MEKVKVIDSIMGAGKTSFAIQMMKEHPEEHYLYITPFSSEIERIVTACPSFKQPEERTDPNDPLSKPRKLHHLKTLMEEGHSVASSHKLFEEIDEDILKIAEDLGYILILDEVMDVLRQPPRRKANGNTYDPNENEDVAEDESTKEWIEGLLAAGVLVKDTGDSCVYLKPGPETRLTEYSHLRKYAGQGRLVLVGGCLLIWQFPARSFTSFKEVWNLTYLFSGTYQRGYYEIHELDFDLYSVVKQGDRYAAVKHSPEYDRPIIEQAQKLIRLYEGPKNKHGEKTGRRDPQSHGWYKNYRSQAHKLMAATAKWFYVKCKVKHPKALWTVHKPIFESGLCPANYAEAFQSMTLRATNEFRDRTAVAYLVNRFFNAPIKKYFDALNVPVSQEQFALSEMIQFVWRSAIRDGKPIDLFVPSARMRGLLFDWLNGNIGNLHPPVSTEKYEPEAA